VAVAQLPILAPVENIRGPMAPSPARSSAEFF